MFPFNALQPINFAPATPLDLPLLRQGRLLLHSKPSRYYCSEEIMTKRTMQQKHRHPSGVNPQLRPRNLQRRAPRQDFNLYMYIKRTRVREK